MGNLPLFQHQKPGSSTASPSSSARPARPFAPIPSPFHQPVSLAKQDVPQAEMDSLATESVQTEKRARLEGNFAHIPLFPDPATLPPPRSGTSALVGQQPPKPRSDVQPVPSALHPFAIQVMQRRERDETQEQNIIPKKNTTGLPDPLKARVETLSGFSLDDIHVHYNSSQPSRVQALAYTQGTEIHVGPGQEQHLAHEAWHVVQQKQGRVQPTMQAKGIAINDDDKLEQEADVMGRQAVTRGRSVTEQLMPLLSASARSKNSGAQKPIQRKIFLAKNIEKNPQIQELRLLNALYKHLDQQKDFSIYIRQVPGETDTRIRLNYNFKEFDGHIPEDLLKENISTGLMWARIRWRKEGCNKKSNATWNPSRATLKMKTMNLMISLKNQRRRKHRNRQIN